MLDKLNVCEVFEVEGVLLESLCFCRIDEKYFGLNEDFNCLFLILVGVEIFWLSWLNVCLLEFILEFCLIFCKFLLLFFLMFLILIVCDFGVFLKRFISYVGEKKFLIVLIIFCNVIYEEYELFFSKLVLVFFMYKVKDYFFVYREIVVL